jgi:hypothetical protein
LIDCKINLSELSIRNSVINRLLDSFLFKKKLPSLDSVKPTNQDLVITVCAEAKQLTLLLTTFQAGDI